MKPRLICATTNKGKVAEIAALLSDAFELTTLAEAGIDADIEEDGETFEQNAVKKAVGFMKLAGCAVLADDSGLEVNALGGAPGVYSARFMGKDTPYAEKNRRLIEMLADAEDRGARFRCVIAVAFPDGRVLTASGALEGEIAHEPQGTGGFGYDPVFYLPAYQMTLAQLGTGRKNEISHRAQALSIMKELLMNTGYE